MTRDRTSLSISARLALAIGMVLIVGGIGISVMAYSYGRQSANAAYDRILAGAAFEISRSMAVMDGDLVVDVPISAFELLALAPEDRVAYRVIGVDGKTLTGDNWVPPPQAHQTGLSYYASDHGTTEFRFVSLQRRFAERSYQGDVTIIVGQTTRARAALIDDITTKAMAIVLIAGAIITLIAVFSLRLALRPLTEIERALVEREPTDLGPLDVSTPRELAIVIAAVNRFISRLAERIASMQNLIGDASHQLRTPIAALRAQAELAMTETDPDKLREMVGRIHRRSGNLARLAEQMLSEAMIIHRADSVARLPIDLRKVAIGVAEDADHLALKAAVDQLRLELPEEPVMIEGDAPSLAEAAKNLVSNAYRYGKAPIDLKVSLGPHAGEASLAVSDHGAGFDAANDGSVGRRFRRYSGSHADSAGLGLAIVSAVAKAHGGRLEFSSEPTGQFVVRLVLPRMNDGNQA